MRIERDGNVYRVGFDMGEKPVLLKEQALTGEQAMTILSNLEADRVVMKTVKHELGCQCVACTKERSMHTLEGMINSREIIFRKTPSVGTTAEFLQRLWDSQWKVNRQLCLTTKAAVKASEGCR